VDSDVESLKQQKFRIKRVINKIQSKLSSSKLISDSTFKENQKGKETRRECFLRKRKLRKCKDNKGDGNDFENKVRHFY
jgi:hypothetical protein